MGSYCITYEGFRTFEQSPQSGTQTTFHPRVTLLLWGEKLRSASSPYGIDYQGASMDSEYVNVANENRNNEYANKLLHGCFFSKASVSLIIIIIVNVPYSELRAFFAA